MSKLQDKKSKTLGSIAAVQTLLEHYPTLTTTDSMLTNFSVNTSVGFLMDLLSILGVTQTELINWVSNLLAVGNDEDNGFLIAVENAVKAILLANIKDMWTCSVNPLLPDSLMKYSNPEFPVYSGKTITTGTTTRPDPCKDIPSSREDYRKIEIDLNQIDMFGMLNFCPSDIDGSIFYFDSYDSILDNEDVTDPSLDDNFKGSFKTLEEVTSNTAVTYENGSIIKTTQGIDRYYVYNEAANNWYPYTGKAAYGPNDLWKSCDFNAYLWYIINKGRLSDLNSLQYSCWDNRVRNIKKLRQNQALRDAFFNINNCTGSTVAEKKTIDITANGDTVQKQQIILCEFEERNDPSHSEGSLPSSNILRVWLNANRYYRTEKVEVPDPQNSGKTIDLHFNKTIFEFNYDYIYSLKLFETKTLIASIINSLLGLTGSVSASVSGTVSMQTKLIEAKVSEIVKKVIEADDQSTSDCYFTFSNEEYDKLLKESKEKYYGSYSTSSLDGRMANLNTGAILDSIRSLKQTGTLKEQIYSISRVLEEVTDAVSTPAAVNGDLEVKFAFGLNFIKDFIQQTVTQIVLHILSPKVAVLYAINSQIMGGDAEEMANLKSWEDFLKNFQNVLFKIIKEIKNVLVEELYRFVMEQLQPLLELMIAKIALETVQYYRELIEQLLLGCVPEIPGINGNPAAIDNVNYADIIEPQQQPEELNKKQC